MTEICPSHALQRQNMTHLILVSVKEAKKISNFPYPGKFSLTLTDKRQKLPFDFPYYFGNFSSSFRSTKKTTNNHRPFVKGNMLCTSPYSQTCHHMFQHQEMVLSLFLSDHILKALGCMNMSHQELGLNSHALQNLTSLS